MLSRIPSRMLSRIVLVHADGKDDPHETIGTLQDKVQLLQDFYRTDIMKRLNHNAAPHYIEVAHPVEYLEYCKALDY